MYVTNMYISHLYLSLYVSTFAVQGRFCSDDFGDWILQYSKSIDQIGKKIITWISLVSKANSPGILQNLSISVSTSLVVFQDNDQLVWVI